MIRIVSSGGLFLYNTIILTMLFFWLDKSKDTREGKRKAKLP